VTGALEPGVVGLEFLQTLGLVDAQAAVLLAPAVEGLLGDAELLDHLGNN